MPIKVKSGEDKNTFISRCMSIEVGDYDKEQKQAAAICYSYWRKANEDVVKKLDKLLCDETVTGDVEIPDDERIGIKYKKKKKKNRLDKDITVHESSAVGGEYIAGTTNIVGSAQGRVIGRRDGEIEVLTRTPKPLRFNRLLGAYLPDMFENEEEGDNE